MTPRINLSNGGLRGRRGGLCVRPLTFVLVALIVAATFVPSMALAQQHYLLIGSARHSFDHPPIVREAGSAFVSAAVIDALGVTPLRGAYQLPGNTLVVGGPAAGDLPASLNQQPLAGADVLDAGRSRYLSLRLFEQLGFRLSYNPLHGVFQLTGRIHRFDYSAADGSLELECLTPISVSARVPKDDRSAINLTIEGGWLERAPLELPTDPLLTRLTVKYQPELGRTLLFARQPERIGYSISSAAPHRARIRFGNYVALERHSKSSSGELGITLKLGAPVEHRAQLAERPARLIVDLPGTLLEAPQSVDAAVGHATRFTLEPTTDGSRLTVELTGRVDYRVLGADAGGRKIVQLLPHATPTAARQLRASRAIMLDAGHGGADPGAIGVVGGIQEKTLNTQITAKLAAELRGLGYTVIETRPDDRYVTLGARGDYANLTLPWLFVSVHCNTITKADIEGAITFIHGDAGAQTRRAAQLVQSELVAATGAVDKGVREEDFFVTRETAMPSLLVECGFMTHTIECGRLCDPNYQARIAKGIAKGIDRYVLEQ